MIFFFWMVLTRPIAAKGILRMRRRIHTDRGVYIRLDDVEMYSGWLGDLRLGESGAIASGRRVSGENSGLFRECSEGTFRGGKHSPPSDCPGNLWAWKTLRWRMGGDRRNLYRENNKMLYIKMGSLLNMSDATFISGDFGLFAR